MFQSTKWIAGAIAVGIGITLAAAPAEAQPRRGGVGVVVGVSSDVFGGGVVLGPGGVEAWVQTGVRHARRRPPPRRAVRYETEVDRDVRRAYERYDRDVFKAREKYDRDVYKAEDRYYRRGDGLRYQRDLHKAEEKFRKAIYKAERRLDERLDRAYRRGWRPR